MTDADRLRNLASLAQPQADEPEIIADAQACRQGALALELISLEAARLAQARRDARNAERAYISRCFAERWGADARQVPSMFIQDLPLDPEST